MTNLAAMRIALFLDQSFPPDSRVENEAHSLVEAGHEVHLFSLNFKKLSPARETVNGIQVHRIKAGKWPWSRQRFRTERTRQALIEPRPQNPHPGYKSGEIPVPPDKRRHSDSYGRDNSRL